MLNRKLPVKFWPIFICAICLLACSAVQCTGENKLYIQVTLKQYSASAWDNDFYKCGHTGVGGGNHDLCAYQLQIEAFSDGITRGRKLFAKAKYSVEISYPVLQDREYQNPATFQLPEYPRHNMSVRVTLHYYSAKGDRIARAFHDIADRLPQVSTEAMQDNEQMTMSGDSHSSFSLELKLFCNKNYFGSMCAKYCLAGSGEYCTQDGDLLCGRTGAPPPCNPTTTSRSVATMTPAPKATTTASTLTIATETQPTAPKSTLTPTATTTTTTTTSTVSKSTDEPDSCGYLSCKEMIVLGGLAIVILLVALTTSILVSCFCRGRKSRDNQDTTPKSQQSQGPQNFVDVPLSHLPQHSPSVVYIPYATEPQMQFHDGTYPRQTKRLDGVSNLIVMPPPPPAPAPLGPDCYFPDGQPHQRSSCSGSSRTCADAWDPPRHPDGVNDVLGQGQPSSMTVNFDTMRPQTYQPPLEFGTSTMRSGDSGGRSSGSRHNLTIRSFQC